MGNRTQVYNGSMAIAGLPGAAVFGVSVPPSGDASGSSFYTSGTVTVTVQGNQPTYDTVFTVQIGNDEAEATATGVLSGPAGNGNVAVVSLSSNQLATVLQAAGGVLGVMVSAAATASQAYNASTISIRVVVALGSDSAPAAGPNPPWICLTTLQIYCCYNNGTPLWFPCGHGNTAQMAYQLGAQNLDGYCNRRSFQSGVGLSFCQQLTVTQEVGPPSWALGLVTQQQIDDYLSGVGFVWR